MENWLLSYCCKSKCSYFIIKNDYEKKEIGIMCDFMPCGDFEKDMLFIQEQYKGLKGKIPENYNPKIF